MPSNFVLLTLKKRLVFMSLASSISGSLYFWLISSSFVNVKDSDIDNEWILKSSILSNQRIACAIILPSTVDSLNICCLQYAKTWLSTITFSWDATFQAKNIYFRVWKQHFCRKKKYHYTQVQKLISSRLKYDEA